MIRSPLRVDPEDPDGINPEERLVCLQNRSVRSRLRDPPQITGFFIEVVEETKSQQFLYQKLWNGKNFMLRAKNVSSCTY